MSYDLIIIGAGPAGLTAAIYARRALLKTLILEKFLSGGKLNKTEDIDNYPGFASIKGPELAERMTEHTKTIIIASGAIENKLGINGEEQFTNLGVSYCAICDGFAFQGKEVAVVGGGYSALETVLYMSNVASKVYLIHRRDEFRAEKEIVTEVKNNPKVTLFLNSVLTEIRGEEVVKEIVISNLADNRESKLLVGGVFPCIGLSPFSSFAHQLGVCDPEKYIAIKEDCSTSIPGLFAAGDVARQSEKKIKQIVTAVAEGAIAAQSVIDNLKTDLDNTSFHPDGLKEVKKLLDQLKTDKTQLEQDKQNLNSQITNLKETIASNQGNSEQASNLNQQLTSKDNEIKVKDGQITSLTNELSQEKQKTTNKDKTIKDQEDIITQRDNTIKAQEGEITKRDIFAPIKTTFPEVIWEKYFISVGILQGSLLSLPIRQFRSMAQISVSEDNIIEIRNLKKVYEDRTVLKNISFSVKRGTIHGFIGPNGAGKTTTIESLMGGTIPNDGIIYIDKKRRSEDENINAKIGFMAEKVRFSDSMKVEDFIHLAGKMRSIPPYEVEKRLRKSDLNNHRYKKCGELSTVLDEPTSGLDPSYRGILLKQLENARERGITVLISSHILSDLQKLVDYVTLINKGEIVYNNKKPDDIEEIYEKLILKEKIQKIKEGQT
nr:9074_t:CDS:2 [Entrophospora candida]